MPEKIGAQEYKHSTTHSIKMPSKRWTCVKCNSPFETRAELEAHLALKTPCDFRCRWCDHVSKSRRSYFNHQRDCTRNPDNRDTRDTVYLQLPVVDHWDLLQDADKRHAMFDPIKSELINHLRREDMTSVWTLVFRTLHANPKYPEYQNIFAPCVQSEEVCMFKSTAFGIAPLEWLKPSWLRHLRDLIRRILWDIPKETTLLTESERDQWLHDVTVSWRTVDESSCPLLMELLHDNRHVVRHLFETYQVRLDVEATSKYHHLLGHPVMNQERLIQPPNAKLLME